jgi:hypothetical protein
MALSNSSSYGNCSNIPSNNTPTTTAFCATLNTDNNTAALKSCCNASAPVAAYSMDCYIYCNLTNGNWMNAFECLLGPEKLDGNTGLHCGPGIDKIPPPGGSKKSTAAQVSGATIAALLAVFSMIALS